MHHQRIKHKYIRYHFIRGVFAKSDVQIHKISAKDNPTNMMTKSLPVFKFERCLDLLVSCKGRVRPITGFDKEDMLNRGQGGDLWSLPHNFGHSTCT